MWLIQDGILSMPFFLEITRSTLNPRPLGKILGVTLHLSWCKWTSSLITCSHIGSLLPEENMHFNTSTKYSSRGWMDGVNLLLQTLFRCGKEKPDFFWQIRFTWQHRHDLRRGKETVRSLSWVDELAAAQMHSVGHHSPNSFFETTRILLATAWQS